MKKRSLAERQVLVATNHPNITAVRKDLGLGHRQRRHEVGTQVAKLAVDPHTTVGGRPLAMYDGVMTKPLSNEPCWKSSTASGDIPSEWLEEFAAAARRPLATRMKYAFIRTYKPVLDDEPFRAFDTMADYRQWCEDNLPSWLGYGRV